MPKAKSAAKAVAPSATANQRLSDLVKHAVELLTKKEELEKALEENSKSLLRIQRTDLPELLKELGISTATLTELGVKVSLTRGVNASIPEEQRPNAFAWLAEKGYGAIVKADVNVEFGAAELEKAEALRDLLVEKNYSPLINMGVHAQTLKAWARERLAAGDELPATLFNISPYDEAKINSVKKK